MVQFLIKKTIKNYEDTKSIKVRSAVGRLCGIVGIISNLFLFAIKFVIGSIVNSVSIRADAINNLTDSCNNFISILSFYIANKPADSDHPFGHERSETIASLFVGIIVGYIGFELGKESIDKILHPSTIDFRLVTVLILIISIAVKLWMYFYNKKLAKTYASQLLEATALDSISDVMGTVAVLVSTIVSPRIGFNLDGYVGIVVSFFILYNAFGLLKDVVDVLLGQAPDPDIVKKISQMIFADEEVLGVHDLIVHNYGPNRLFASAHVEVDASKDIFRIHDHIDNVERIVKEEMDIDLVLHMDPILVNDPKTDYYKEKVAEAISQLGKEWTFHDFRIVSGQTHTNLIFDLVVPFDEKTSRDEIIEMLKSKMPKEHPLYFVITIDHPMA